MQFALPYKINTFKSKSNKQGLLLDEIKRNN